MVKKPPTMQEPQEMRVRSLRPEDALEQGMATHSRILAWRIPRTEEPGRVQTKVSQSQTRLKWLSSHNLFLVTSKNSLYILCLIHCHFLKRLYLLICLFLVVLDLCCRAQTSLVSESRGFACCGAQTPGTWSSVVAACGPSGCGA